MNVYPTHTCFDDAAEFIELLLKDCKGRRKMNAIIARYFIVHAICKMPSGELYAHAWVNNMETNESIFKGIIEGEAMYLMAGRAEYEAHLNVQLFTSYTMPEFAELHFLHGTTGPFKDNYKALTREGKKAIH